MFEYFYNEILRRTIISFGTLFNGITVKQDGGDIRVPLAYGPTQKFLARLTQTPDLNKATAITLPRMSFEFTGLTYDPYRKVNTTQQFTEKDPNDVNNKPLLKSLFIVNFKKSIIGSSILSPLDLEEKLGLLGGDIMHGVMTLDQMWAARPVFNYGDYKTPIKNLFICGSGSHPGGGVTGLPGKNSSREILKS